MEKWRIKINDRVGLSVFGYAPGLSSHAFFLSFDVPCVMERSLLNIISKDGSLVAYQPAGT